MALKMRVLTKFPSRVQGESLITVDTVNGVTTIGYDPSKLISTTSIPNPSDFETVIINKQTGLQTRGTLALFGGGTTTATSVVTANGFAGTVANPSTTPAITIKTTVTGITKGDGTGLSAAVPGVDYSAGTSALATGILKSTTSTGALSIATAGDYPTLNQNTTGSAATLTTARLLAGNSFNGSANVPFANKFIVQGTTDTGLTGAQFLGALATGLLKNTTTTGVLSVATAGTDFAPGTASLATGILKSTTATGALTIATAADYPTLNQNTTGSAATVTGPFSGDVGGTQSATVIQPNAVTLGKMAQLASFSVIGNNTGSTATPSALSPSQILDIIGSTQGSLLYRAGAQWSALGPGTAGQVLASGGSGANPIWQTVSGSGTVTSVGLSMPGIFSVTGSPITGFGTFGVTLASQSPNLIFAGPATGGSGAPTFRSFVPADLGSVGANQGEILFRGSAGWVVLAPGTSGQVLKTNGAGNDVAWTTVSGTGTVTTVSVVTANGFAGTVANAATAPAITLTTSITGLLKGNGTAISAATAGTDYQAPMTVAAGSDVNTGTDNAKYVTASAIAGSHAWQTLTDGATVNWNMASGYNAKVTIAGNRTLATPTNPIEGRVYQLQIIQDGTGSRTMTFPASTIFDFGGAGTPTLSTGANKMDLLTLTCLNASTPLFRVGFNKGS